MSSHRPKRKQSSPRPAAGRKARAIVDQPSPRLDGASRHLAEGRREEAFKLYEEAIRKEPGNVRVYVAAARAYGNAYRYDRMEAVHRQLVRLAPEHPGIHHLIGETFADLKLPQRAVECYETAAGLPGTLPPTWVGLAAIYEQAHRLEEAETLIERAVGAGYGHPFAKIVLARIQRRLKRTEDAESTLRDLIAHVPEGDESACEAWGEIALMKDKHGDYDGAIEAIERCKRGQRARQEPYWSATQRTGENVQQAVDAFTPAHLDRWREETAGVPERDVALLTGFPRSGTTLLEQVLDAHPRLVSSEERDYLGKEPPLPLLADRGDAPLLEALDRPLADQIAQQRKQYFRAMEYLLGEPIGPRMHLDKGPASNRSLLFILRVFPEMRFVIAIRDPRDVILSCFMRYLGLTSVSVYFLDFERVARRYAEDMATWLKLRDRIPNPWCQVRYEDAIDDLAGQARVALDTLGLPWDESVLGYRERLKREKQVTSPTYEAVAQPLHKGAIGRWRHYERYMAPAFDVLRPFIREFGYES